jgi:L-threonylcarbamoyladenylate synthase
MVGNRAADWFQLEVAAGVILSGGVILHATEGVWGIACDPFAEAAVRRVAAMKRRRQDKGFVLIGAAGEFDSELDDLSLSAREEVTASWPGPVTWVVPNRRFPGWVAANGGADSPGSTDSSLSTLSTVAIRVPGHDQALRLAALCGSALISTSANPTGRTPARSGMAARAYFGGQVDFVLPGRTNFINSGVEVRGAASEIRVAGSGHIARARPSR